MILLIFPIDPETIIISYFREGHRMLSVTREELEHIMFTPNIYTDIKY